MTSIKHQMRLSTADIISLATIAPALASSRSVFQNRSSVIRYSFTLVKRLIDAGLLSRVEGMLAEVGPKGA